MKQKVIFFVGPEKTGTTTIFDSLPFRYPPRQKEHFNLSRRKDFGAELKRISTQLRLEPVAYIVEPTYFTSEFARTSIASLTGTYDIHVVHCQREPLARSVSHYLHHKSKGRVRSVPKAVKLYPEILEGSFYDIHCTKWAELVPNFHVVNIDEPNAIDSVFLDLGIKKRKNAKSKSNVRLAPRSLSIAASASTLWGVFIRCRLNRFVPNWLKKEVKSVVYYGGNTVSISELEKEQLRKYLATMR